MIAKLIVTSQTREEAIDKMRRALDEFVIEGIKTTIPFHRQLMDDPNLFLEIIQQNLWKLLRFKRPKLEKVFGYFFGNLNSIGSGSFS